MQTQQYQQRAAALDRDNQELQSLLAQSKQQSQLLEGASAGDADPAPRHDQPARHAASRQRANAVADHGDGRLDPHPQPGRDPLEQQPAAQPHDYQLAGRPGPPGRRRDPRRDPCDQLFNPGTAQLKIGADELLRSVGADLFRNYPQQMIGIEGHTDNGSAATRPSPRTAQHLSVAQATTVYDALVRAAGMSATQLFVVGHGANHPVVSNATDAGRARNRRIELVIYPETMTR